MCLTFFYTTVLRHCYWTRTKDPLVFSDRAGTVSSNFFIIFEQAGLELYRSCSLYGDRKAYYDKVLLSLIENMA